MKKRTFQILLVSSGVLLLAACANKNENKTAESIMSEEVSSVEEESVPFDEVAFSGDDLATLSMPNEFVRLPSEVPFGDGLDDVTVQINQNTEQFYEVTYQSDGGVNRAILTGAIYENQDQSIARLDELDDFHITHFFGYQEDLGDGLIASGERGSTEQFLFWDMGEWQYNLYVPLHRDIDPLQVAKEVTDELKKTNFPDTEGSRTIKIRYEQGTELPIIHVYWAEGENLYTLQTNSNIAQLSTLLSSIEDHIPNRNVPMVSQSWGHEEEPNPEIGIVTGMNRSDILFPQDFIRLPQYFPNNDRTGISLQFAQDENFEPRNKLNYYDLFYAYDHGEHFIRVSATLFENQEDALYERSMNARFLAYEVPRTDEVLPLANGKKGNVQYFSDHMQMHWETDKWRFTVSKTEDIRESFDDIANTLNEQLTTHSIPGNFAIADMNVIYNVEEIYPEIYVSWVQDNRFYTLNTECAIEDIFKVIASMK